jgi:hypothetical protein
MPTRSELDEAYQVIHELKMEIRALKKALLPAAPGGGGQGQHCAAQGCGSACQERMSRQPEACVPADKPIDL